MSIFEIISITIGAVMVILALIEFWRNRKKNSRDS